MVVKSKEEAEQESVLATWKKVGFYLLEAPREIEHNNLIKFKFQIVFSFFSFSQKFEQERKRKEREVREGVRGLVSPLKVPI